jgi:hypothetical protein
MPFPHRPRSSARHAARADVGFGPEGRHLSRKVPQATQANLHGEGRPYCSHGHRSSSHRSCRRAGRMAKHVACRREPQITSVVLGKAAKPALRYIRSVLRDLLDVVLGNRAAARGWQPSFGVVVLPVCACGDGCHVGARCHSQPQGRTKSFDPRGGSGCAGVRQSLGSELSHRRPHANRERTYRQ